MVRDHPRAPPAEHHVDAALVTALLAEQHRDLASLEVTYFDEGWDNTVWRLGDELLVRLPRRAMAAPAIEHEQRWLPVLAAVLPLPIPVPVRVGIPGHGFPWRWSVVPLLPGSPAIAGVHVDGPRAAASLGGFLRALHVPSPPDAPDNPYRGVPLSNRTASFEQAAADLSGVVDVTAIRRIWDRGLAAARHAVPVWVHGDPHPGNLLVDRGELVAVIDFNDLTYGDPATDLAGAWLLLEPDDADALLAAYGAPDEDLVARARGWAALFTLFFLCLGDEGLEGFGAVGLRAHRVLLDSERR